MSLSDSTAGYGLTVDQATNALWEHVYRKPVIDHVTTMTVASRLFGQRVKPIRFTGTNNRFHEHFIRLRPGRAAASRDEDGEMPPPDRGTGIRVNVGIKGCFAALGLTEWEVALLENNPNQFGNVLTEQVEDAKNALVEQSDIQLSGDGSSVLAEVSAAGTYTNGEGIPVRPHYLIGTTRIFAGQAPHFLYAGLHVAIYRSGSEVSGVGHDNLVRIEKEPYWDTTNQRWQIDINCGTTDPTLAVGDQIVMAGAYQKEMFGIRAFLRETAPASAAIDPYVYDAAGTYTSLSRTTYPSLASNVIGPDGNFNGDLNHGGLLTLTYMEHVKQHLQRRIGYNHDLGDFVVLHDPTMSIWMEELYADKMQTRPNDRIAKLFPGAKRMNGMTWIELPEAYRGECFVLRLRDWSMLRPKTGLVRWVRAGSRAPIWREIGRYGKWEAYLRTFEQPFCERPAAQAWIWGFTGAAKN